MIDCLDHAYTQCTAKVFETFSLGWEKWEEKPLNSRESKLS